MKPSTIIVLVLMVPAMIGYLYYGWLLFQTVMSETNIGLSIVFTNLFILWLMPHVVGLVLLIMELVRKMKLLKKR